jgi:restriction endonuclease
MSKRLLTTILTLGVIASVGYFGTNFVLADEENPMHQTLISRIAQKFNLSETDVKAVFESVRDERLEEMKTEREEKLSQAVSDGILTEVQKQALLSKMEELMGERQQNKEKLRAWFSEQGIDETKLRDYLGPVGRGEGRGIKMPR